MPNSFLLKFNKPSALLVGASHQSRGHRATIFLSLALSVMGSSWTGFTLAAEGSAKPSGDAKAELSKPVKPVPDRPEQSLELTAEKLQKALTQGANKGTLTVKAGTDAVIKIAAPGVATDAGHGEAKSVPVKARKTSQSQTLSHPASPQAITLAKAHMAATTKAMAPEAVSASGHSATQAHAEPHWTYAGENGPQAWAKLKPEFNTCAAGTRQSPIHIEDDSTLQGPAEPLAIKYVPSGGSVVNNGHTIQIDVTGENTLTIRGTTYKLLQFHAHHPAEERINQKGFAMVMHLVHRSQEGKLAVLAVLLDPGPSNALIQKIWTHMPLDVFDRVKVPAELINMNELLPQDLRYYQFMGSLTTPPCSEGILWMVLKQPVSLSREQLRTFAKIFPNNARPLQALNGRMVRNAE